MAHVGILRIARNAIRSSFILMAINMGIVIAIGLDPDPVSDIDIEYDDDEEWDPECL